MPGRTLSASSEKSDDGGEHATISGQTTPTWLPNQPYRRYGTPPISHTVGSAPGTMSTRLAPTADSSTSEQVLTRSTDTGSGPIAIDIPRIKRITSTSVYTPPEPLSARGDLPGGYFPMHEDPKTRVHHPHPFHSQDRQGVRDLTLADFSARPEGSSATKKMSSSMSTRNSIPVASYLPTGCHDTPLPMGKYYPSNYENQQKAHVSRTRSATVSSTSSKSRDQLEPFINSSPTSNSAHDPDVRRKLQLQQYQRDMIAQASLAANELLSSSGHGRSGPPKLGNLPGKALSFGPPFHNPSAPKLHPLGSPGPVTPMDLESSRGGNGYFEMSQGDNRTQK
ncbi:unnamed protein product [Clonostachys rhizophaga]|uniref:Uncharacterized protein n=1 Tax=Clonostachys rhizophaga TaxID=160324 RepID=A0A9N9V0J4_9HYPO|nr:unnamed protein product [Clonostachys rhizophaga]